MGSSENQMFAHLQFLNPTGSKNFLMWLISGSSQVQVWPQPHQRALLPHRTPHAAACLAAAPGHPATSSFRTPRQRGGRDALRGEPPAAAATSWLPGRPALAAGRALAPALFSSERGHKEAARSGAQSSAAAKAARRRAKPRRDAPLRCPPPRAPRVAPWSAPRFTPG